MKSNRFFTARTIAYLAVLIALVVVLQLFASAIPMFGVTLNFSLIPIVLAGIFFGAYGGGLVGLVSGLVTFITTAVMGREPSTAFLFQASPVILTIVCIGKTTLAGVVARNTVSGDREKERTDCFLCRRAHRCGREYGNLSAGDGDHEKRRRFVFGHGSNSRRCIRDGIRSDLAELCFGNRRQSVDSARFVSHRIGDRKNGGKEKRKNRLKPKKEKIV